MTIWRNALAYALRYSLASTYCVSIADEDVFVRSWVNSDKIEYLVIDLEFQGGHRVDMNSVEGPEELID